MKLEKSPKYNLAANGRVENGLTRVRKDALEANIKQSIGPNMPVMAFMAGPTATNSNRKTVDQDGRTPMEKARGAKANLEMVEFGEKVLFQQMTK